MAHLWYLQVLVERDGLNSGSHRFIRILGEREGLPDQEYRDKQRPNLIAGGEKDYVENFHDEWFGRVEKRKAQQGVVIIRGEAKSRKIVTQLCLEHSDQLNWCVSYWQGWIVQEKTGQKWPIVAGFGKKADGFPHFLVVNLQAKGHFRKQERVRSGRRVNSRIVNK